MFPRREVVGSAPAFFARMSILDVSQSRFRFATPTPHGLLWLLKRNCSVTPAQLGWIYVSLCVVSLGIATGFWLHGATLIMPFAWVELALVGAAFLAYARHATDGERIALQGASLVVEQENAGRLLRAEFDRAWVRVEPVAANTGLIELSGQGRSVQVGRFVRPELREQLAREIRSALRMA
jgi:uncharacterized membrane protein